jgi:putative flippase GtrA
MSLGVADVSRLPLLLGTGAARPIRFGAVGLVTFGVQLGSFFVLKLAGMPSILAYAFGLALSVQFNFIVNQLLVWADRPLTSLLSWQFAERWATFHGCIALSLVINLGAFVIAQVFLPDIAAAIIGVLCSTAVKFVSLDRLAFRPSRFV